MKKTASLLPLCAGLALGAGAAWTLLHFSAPRISGATARPAAPSPLPAPSGSPLPAPTAQLLLPPPLAGTEADAALDAYLALPPLAKDAPADVIQPRLGHLRALLTLLPASHFERLFAALATRTGDAEAQLRRAAYDVWTEQDAPAAARWALSVVPGDAINAASRSRYLTQAVAAWARDDFSAAYAWAGAIGDQTLRHTLLARALGQLAARDPHQAAALAQSGDAAFVKAAQRAVFETWAERDPVAALKTLGPTLLEQRDRPWSVQQAMIKWITRDPATALDWAAAQPAPDGDNYRHILGNLNWSIVDNPKAVRPYIDLLASREDIPNRAQVLQNLIGAWARKDSSATLDWLHTVTDRAQRSDLASSALGYIEPGRPDDFLALARLLPDSQDRQQKISDHLSTWAKKDPDAAIAWLAKQDDPALAGASAKIEGTLVASLAATDPAAATARWQSLPPGPARYEAAGQLALGWAKTDSAAAARWLAQQLPDAGLNDGASHQAYYQIQTVATGWAAKDPLGFAEWAQSLPEGIKRETALSALVRPQYQEYGEVSVDRPPRSAFADQLAKLPDAQLRERALTSHLQTWFRSDVRAARAWIDSNDALSPEAVARLLTQAGIE